MKKARSRNGLSHHNLPRNIICLFTSATFISCCIVIVIVSWTAFMLPTHKPLIEELTCPAPKLQPPKNNTVTNYVLQFKYYVCADGFHYAPVITSDGKSLRKINSTLLNSEFLQCIYAQFARSIDKSGMESYRFSNRKYVVKSGRTINAEFVKTACSASGIKNPGLDWAVSKIKYDFFSMLPTKSKKFGSMDRSTGLNVVIMGISGVSRSEFHNNFPETLNYLKLQFDMLEYRYLQSQSKDSTKNLLYLLTGNRYDCMDQTNGFAKCTFIFEQLKYLRNYQTVIAEDCVENSEVKFGHLPNNRLTDYYWNTFYHAYKDHFGGGKCSVCVGKKLSYELVLDYQKRFITKMEQQNSRYFGYFWVNSLKNIQNYGRFIDEDYKKLFEFLRYSGLYNRTAIFFLSDGAVGDDNDSKDNLPRIPFLFLHVPMWFKQAEPLGSNLYLNQERMVTFQDLYNTLVYITETYRRYSSYGLFDLVDGTRNCDNANIDHDVCSC